MEVTIDKSKLSNVVDAYSGVCFADTANTIQKHLNRRELWRYTKVMNKVQMMQSLNLKDLQVLDKIDALTFEYHGMCLKDSLVTKARLKACKKYHIEFVDRDGLVDHMNCMLQIQRPQEQESNYSREIAEFFIEKLGDDLPIKLSNIVSKLNAKEDLALEDLNFLSDMELLASQELEWSIMNPELEKAINKACNKLGIYFQNLQPVSSH